MAGILSGPWNWKRVKSFAMLGVAFWRRQFRRLFRGRKDDGGAERFLANFSPEGMRPLSLPEEDLIHRLGACIHCGLCEAVCPLPVDRWPAYSRAIAMASEAAADVPRHCPKGCAACVDVCPTGVPLSEIPAFIHRHPTSETG